MIAAVSMIFMSKQKSDKRMILNRNLNSWITDIELGPRTKSAYQMMWKKKKTKLSRITANPLITFIMDE